MTGHRLAACWTFAPIAAAVIVYALCWPLVTGDITGAYIPWLVHIETTGPVAAFAVPFGDYAPPFLYLLALASLLKGWFGPVTLVKLVSVVGTGFLTVALRSLLAALGVERPWRLAAFAPMLPGVAMNASIMASGDALWAAPCVAALACAARRRHIAMLAWCGVALSVKQQAIFVAPFFLGLLIARRVPLRHWLAAPAGFLAMYVPAWAGGWQAAGLLSVYARQAGFYSAMSLNAPNFWTLLQPFSWAARVDLTPVALLAAGGAGAWLAARVATARLDARALVGLALLSPLLLAGLLPRMHERYFFLADILSLAWVAVAPSRETAVDAALIQAGSTLAILAFAINQPALASAGAVAMIIATARIARALMAPSGDRVVNARPANGAPMRVA